MKFRTKGELEAAIGSAVMKFEREYFGRGPKELQTFVVQDVVLIRQKGILTPAEEQVRENPDSVDLIRRLREALLKNNQEILRAVLQQIIGVNVVSLYTDLSVKDSEKFMIVTFESNLESFFRGNLKRRSG